MQSNKSMKMKKYKIANYTDLKKAQENMQVDLGIKKLQMENSYAAIKRKYSFTSLSDLMKESIRDDRSGLNQLDYLEVGSRSILDTVLGSALKGRSPIIRLLTQTAANIFVKKSSKTIGTGIYKLFSKFTS